MVELHAGLPWIRKPEAETKKIKNDTSDEQLMKDCPIEWIKLMQHIRSLKYETRPNYRLLYDILIETLARLKVALLDPYDWEECVMGVVQSRVIKEKVNILVVFSDANNYFLVLNGTFVR